MRQIMHVMRTTLIAATTVAALVSFSPAWSEEDVWHATRALLPGDIIRADDVSALPLQRPLPESVSANQDIVGQEVKRRVTANRPLTARDIGPRTAVQASTPVDVLWSNGPLKIAMSGRAMESGALGAEIRVLNTASGRTIRGIIVGDGMIEVRSVP
jgi:flagella basal body P-ring formation protein FlgA